MSPHLLTYDGFPKDGSKLASHHLMLGCAVLFHKKWGAVWPTKVRFILFDNSKAQNFKRAYDLSDAMKALESGPPDLGVAMLCSASHIMIFICYGDVVFGLDGYCEQHALLKPLAEGALKILSKCGVVCKNKIDYPQLWKQNDSDSCGYFCLDFVNSVLFEAVLTDASKSYHPPDNCDWKPLCAYLESLVEDVSGAVPTVEAMHHYISLYIIMHLR